MVFTKLLHILMNSKWKAFHDISMNNFFFSNRSIADGLSGKKEHKIWTEQVPPPYIEYLQPYPCHMENIIQFYHPRLENYLSLDKWTAHCCCIDINQIYLLSFNINNSSSGKYFKTKIRIYNEIALFVTMKWFDGKI